ncbi:hypothetical protein RQP46_000050 [Phenoliferia psychrophenolica]
MSDISLSNDAPAPPPSSIPDDPIQLPYELLSVVFHHFLAPFDFDDPATARSVRKTLCAAALVCSHWRDPAQRALNEHPLFTDSTHKPPIAWLNGEARKRYIVRKMDFATQRYGVDASDVRKVLEAAGSFLEEVRLGYITSGTSWTLLTLPAVSQLKRLTLPKLEWWDFPPGSEIPPLHLISLNLTLRRDPPNSALLCALVAAASTTLQTLELDLAEPGQPGAGADLVACLDAFLPIIAPKILHLVLVMHSKVDGIERVLARFSALESCTLDFRNELDHLPSLDAVADAIPNSIKTLVLGFERRRNPDPELGVVLAKVAASMQARTALKRIELLGVEEVKEPVTFLAECEAREIEVVLVPKVGLR